MQNDVKMVSIDSSTRRTGMALFNNGELEDYGLIDLSKSELEVDERIVEMGGKIFQALNIWKPSIVYIEQPQGHGKNVAMVRKLSELIGFVKAWGYINDAYVLEVAPSVWRKYVGLEQGGKKRDELKQESINAVKDVYGVWVVDDVADAINLGTGMINKFQGE